MDPKALRQRFDESDATFELGDGSLDAVKARAGQRDRRSAVARVVAVLAVVAGLGFGLFQTLLASQNEVNLDVADPNGEQDNAIAPEGDDATPTPQATATTGRLSEADIEYVGTFSTPATDDFDFGGFALAFNPTNNSLYISGFPINSEVAEISIPDDFAPHDGSRTDLPTADLIQPFGDITGGLGDALIGSTSVRGQDDFRINGLEVVDGDDGPRLHWTATQFGNAGEFEGPGHGHSSLDLSNPDVAGPWFLGDFTSEESAGYLFEVPESFAESFFDGQRLLSGYQVEVGTLTSQGAPFFAFDVPGSQSRESRLEVTELVNYEFPDRESETADQVAAVRGADWVETSDGRSAIVTANNRMPRDNAEICSLGNTTDVSAFGPQLSMYDPADLAAVVAGNAEPFDVEPYLTLSLEDVVIPVCGAQLSSVAFDPDTNRLFVVQTQVTATRENFDARPAIHVFEVG